MFCDIDELGEAVGVFWVDARDTSLRDTAGRADLTPLDRPYRDRAVEYDVFGKQLAQLGGCRFTGFRSLRKGCIVIPPMLCQLLLKSSKSLASIARFFRASNPFSTRAADKSSDPEFAGGRLLFAARAVSSTAPSVF